MKEKNTGFQLRECWSPSAKVVAIRDFIVYDVMNLKPVLMDSEDKRLSSSSSINRPDNMAQAYTQIHTLHYSTA
jgi:hypothetical protein